MSKLKPLAEQVIVTTGASSGIGRAIALMATRDGATIVVAARGEPGLDSLVDEIAAAGVQAASCPTDVTDPFGISHRQSTSMSKELPSPRPMKLAQASE